MVKIPPTWSFADTTLDCSTPIIMGIINTTPDSFSDGGHFLDPKSAIDHGLNLIDQGADILDIGGESTRPGSEYVSVDTELDRVIPVIEGIQDKQSEIPISIDTRKLDVAIKAHQAGASIINDVSALRHDPELADFIAEKNLGVVLMHMLGDPENMQNEPEYNDVVSEIGEFFQDRIAYSQEKGIPSDNIVLDPGIGFGKLLSHNLTILNRCGNWHDFGRPILIGSSRKRFIGEILNAEVSDRLYGTIGSCVSALYSGARIFRVHDVGPVKQALEVATRIMNVRAGEN